MNFNYWNEHTICRWNKKTFVDNTPRQQRRKCNIEAVEYYEATTKEEKIKELADVFIASAGAARRYGDKYAQLVCDLMRKLSIWPEINQAVQKKMFINLERTWKKTHTGEQRHVGED